MAVEGKHSHRGLAPLIRKTKAKYPELNNHEIARAVGCDESNVRGVLRDFLRDTSIDRLRDYQSNQADIFDTKALEILESITPAKLLKANALQLTTSFAILVDKARLVRGQATSINVTVLQSMVTELRAMRDAKPVIDAPQTLDPIENN